MSTVSSFKVLEHGFANSSHIFMLTGGETQVSYAVNKFKGDLITWAMLNVISHWYQHLLAVLS